MKLNKIDDYLDGAMSGAEREAFEAKVAADPALAKEVEFGRALRAAIRQAALEEPVPNLMPALAAVARPTAASIFAKWAPAGVAAIALFGIGIAVNRTLQYQFNPVIADAKALPAIGHIETKSMQVMSWEGSDPVAGAAKIRETFYRTIPDIDLRPFAELKGTRCGSCWFNYRYEYKGSLYDVYGRCENGSLDTGRQKPAGKEVLFVFTDAVGWYDRGGMTYTVLGGNANGRLEIAQAASKQTCELR